MKARLTRRAAAGWFLLSAVMALAAGLRCWGVLSGELVWHPDEIFLVAFPLGFLSGDLNPHHFHYPSLHFYALGAVYGTLYLLDLLGGHADALYDWVALHGLFQPERLRDAARWVSVAYSIGTVASTAALADRVYGSRRRQAGLPDARGDGGLAAVIAGLLMAVNVLHVRQTPVASVDTAMTFWFTAAVWAGTRLVDHRGTRDYVLAGALVGLAAGTKYPGAACAGAIAAAHLQSRRGALDRRLWIAGATSAIAFVAVSPFVLLDFAAYRDDFGFQVSHVVEGTGPVFLAPLYHLWFSLRYSLGWPAWVATIAAVALALVRREPREGVIVATLLFAYATVSWGQLVFARYALPLMPLQATLVAGIAIAAGGRLASRWGGGRAWSLVILAALALSPLSRSIALARLEARTDTRTLARDWMEANIPSYARCCNFGGWAGDVQAHTFEHLWWLLLRHEEAFGLERLEHALPWLTAQVEGVPYYEFVVGGERTPLASGNWDVVHQTRCAYVLLHEHSLPSSHVDTAFVRQLRRRGHLLARFRPGDGEEGGVFDPMDAYYLPVSGMDAVARPGPKVEIWRLPQAPAGGQAAPDVPRLLARAHGLLSIYASSQGHTALAVRALGHGARYDPKDAKGLEAWARIAERHGRLEDALQAYDYLQEREPGFAEGLLGRARLLAAAGRLEDAIHAYQAAADLRQGDPLARRELAAAMHRTGRVAEAIAAWRLAVDLDSTSAAAHFDLATALDLAGDAGGAAAAYDRAVALAPDSARYWAAAGVAHERAGDPARDAELRAALDRIAAAPTSPASRSP